MSLITAIEARIIRDGSECSAAHPTGIESKTARTTAKNLDIAGPPASPTMSTNRRENEVRLLQKEMAEACEVWLAVKMEERI